MTHTFQLPCGEFTLTPSAFAAITGLPCSGVQVPFDEGIFFADEATSQGFITDILGRMPTLRNDRMMKCEDIPSWFHGMVPITQIEFDRMARCFILFLLGMTLFCDDSHALPLYFIPLVRDFDEMGTFDWGSAALAYLYHCMDRVSYGLKKLNGFWHALQVFIYYYYYYFFFVIIYFIFFVATRRYGL